MRILLAASAVLALSACGAYSFPSGTVAARATVTGHVLAVPCTPVEQPNNPCAGRPQSGLDITFSSGGGAVVSTTTDSTGQYAVQLDAGTWKVTFKSFMRLIKGPQTITVAAGDTIVADYFVDSGIRVPVPPGPPVTAPG
jgi:hypothetical protein